MGIIITCKLPKFHETSAELKLALRYVNVAAADARDQCEPSHFAAVMISHHLKAILQWLSNVTETLILI